MIDQSNSIDPRGTFKYGQQQIVNSNGQPSKEGVNTKISLQIQENKTLGANQNKRSKK